MVFTVKVEEYAELVLKGSTDLVTQTETAEGNVSRGAHIWAAAPQEGDAVPPDCANSTDVASRKSDVSCPQVYSTGTLIAPLVSLVVNMRDGRISSFVWDRTCGGCGLDSCAESSSTLNLETGAGEGGTSRGG